MCLAAAAALGACDSAARVLKPLPQPPDSSASAPGYPGFDISVYPGDGALAAWAHPSSPYRWVGYYLAAPCHRDTTWMGTRARVEQLGFGTAVLYVGQQDWASMPAAAADVPSFSVSGLRAILAAASPACSAVLLTTAQGAGEAADAVAKATAEGFPAGSSIFLDVEYVTQVTPALVDYYKAWITGVLVDGRYRPGVYCATRNVPDLQSAALEVYQAARHTGAPAFWIAQSTGFSATAHPRDLGIPYAAVWQGLFDTTQSWNGVRLVIDVDVADQPSPSAPPTLP